MKKIIIYFLIFILFLIFSFQCAPPSGGGDEPPPQPNSPNLLWAKRLGGNLEDCGYSIITDSNDNIIVIGNVKGNADLNNDGAIAGEGESASNYGMNDIVIVKFDSGGAYQWSKRLGGLYNDKGCSISIGTNDNIYVTGIINGNADLNGDGDNTDGGAESSAGYYGMDDIFIAKFNSDGNFQWAKRLGGIGNDEGCSIALDSNNNVFVTGYVNYFADLNGNGNCTDGGAEDATGYGMDDIFIVEFNSEGECQGSKRLGGASNDKGYGIIIDSSNNLIITGSVYGDVDLNGDGDKNDDGEELSTCNGDNDIFIVKFDDINDDGQWSKRLGGTLEDCGYSIITDSNNNVYVTGCIRGNADLNGDGDKTDGGAESTFDYNENDKDIFIVKFDLEGNHQWSKRLGGELNDFGYGLSIDSSNNVIITGSIINNADLNGDRDSNDGKVESGSGYGYDDIFIVKFDSSGIFHKWSLRLGGLEIDKGYSVIIDSSDNIIVTGCIESNADLNGDGDSNDGGAESSVGYGSNDIFVVKFNN